MYPRPGAKKSNQTQAYKGSFWDLEELWKAREELADVKFDLLLGSNKQTIQYAPNRGQNC